MDDCSNRLEKEKQDMLRTVWGVMEPSLGNLRSEGILLTHGALAAGVCCVGAEHRQNRSNISARICRAANCVSFSIPIW